MSYHAWSWRPRGDGCRADAGAWLTEMTGPKARDGTKVERGRSVRQGGAGPYTGE